MDRDHEFRRIVIIGSGDHDHAGDGGRAAAADSLQPRVVSIFCRGAGGGMPGERVSMRKIREVLAAAVGAGAAAAGDREEPAAEPGCGERLPGPGAAGGPGLAVAGRAGRRAARGTVISAAAGCAGGAAAGSGLGGRCIARCGGRT